MDQVRPAVAIDIADVKATDRSRISRPWLKRRQLELPVSDREPCARGVAHQLDDIGLAVCIEVSRQELAGEAVVARRWTKEQRITERAIAIGEQRVCITVGISTDLRPEVDPVGAAIAIEI